MYICWCFPDPVQRLRKHNGEICGGAKYTLLWDVAGSTYALSGFHDKIQSMQFEWAVKHVKPRNVGGKKVVLESLLRY